MFFGLFKCTVEFFAGCADINLNPDTLRITGSAIRSDACGCLDHPSALLSLSSFLLKASDVLDAKDDRCADCEREN